jgi:hypothetical protein
MNRQKQFAGVLLVGILLLGAWALGWFERKDPVLAELEKQRDADFARQEQMSEEERQATREEFGKKMRGLTEEQRRAFFENSMPIFLKMFERQVDSFLEKSPEEQRKEMDKRIDEMKARGQTGPGGGPGGRGGGPSPKQVDEWRKKMLDWTTPEQRAKFDTAFQKFNERLQQRGMNSGAGGGFF